jgi:cytochrome bd-type quinol oxidase subunit 2
LLCGIAFLVVGLLFAGAGFYLKQPSSVQKAPISAVAGTIFYIIGALTAIAGIFAIAFHGGAPKLMVEIVLLLYLAVVTVLLVVFTCLVKSPGEK